MAKIKVPLWGKPNAYAVVNSAGSNDATWIESGTLVLGDYPPDYYYWYNAYPHNSYLTMNKATADNDASIVFTEAGRAKWEFGATTELTGDPPRLHLKRVLNPTNDAADDQFLDVLTVEYPSGNIWLDRGYQFWVGALPSVEEIPFAVTELFDANDRRVTMMIENWNAVPDTSTPAAGSQSSTLLLGGVNTKWSLGNDVGLDGGHNFYVQDENAASESFRIYADTYGVAINGTYLNPTEAFRIDSKSSSAQGFLPPVMTTAFRDTMGGKEAGLIIFNSDTETLQYWSVASSSWVDVGASAAIITSTIANGDTTHAPSGDAVFDALALKANKSGDTFTGLTTFNAGVKIASGGTFAQGVIYRSASLGMVVAPIAGTSYDWLLTDRSGNAALSLAANTKNLTAWGAFAAADTISVDKNGLGSDAAMAITVDAGQRAQFDLRTSGVNRWSVLKSNVAESGSNAGSGLVLRRYSDAGANLGDSISIDRATGVVTLEATPNVNGTDLWAATEAWQAPALQNSWINYGGGFATAGYRKVGNRVFLRGMIKSGATTQGAQLFTLPAGYRPASAEVFVATTSTGACRLTISSGAGTVNIANVADNTFLSLSGISFMVD